MAQPEKPNWFPVGALPKTLHMAEGGHYVKGWGWTPEELAYVIALCEYGRDSLVALTYHCIQAGREVEKAISVGGATYGEVWVRQRPSLPGDDEHAFYVDVTEAGARGAGRYTRVGI